MTERKAELNSLSISQAPIPPNSPSPRSSTALQASVVPVSRSHSRSRAGSHKAVRKAVRERSRSRSRSRSPEPSEVTDLHSHESGSESDAIATRRTRSQSGSIRRKQYFQSQPRATRRSARNRKSPHSKAATSASSSHNRRTRTRSAESSSRTARKSSTVSAVTSTTAELDAEINSAVTSSSGVRSMAPSQLRAQRHVPNGVCPTPKSLLLSDFPSLRQLGTRVPPGAEWGERSIQQYRRAVYTNIRMQELSEPLSTQVYTPFELPKEDFLDIAMQLNIGYVPVPNIRTPFELPPDIAELIVADRPPKFTRIKRNSRRCKIHVSAEDANLKCDCDPKRGRCDSDCINRMLARECDRRNCNLNDPSRCCNRNFTRKRKPVCEPFRTPLCGWGLRTTKRLRSDTFVIEYVGEVISQDECTKRIKALYKKHKPSEPSPALYFMSLNDEWVIDACHKGGFGRFTNHSCDPNCVVQTWHVENEIRVGIFTRRPVRAGEELTIDYRFREMDEDVRQLCYCGAPNCAKVIGGETKDTRSDKQKKKKRKKKATPADFDDACFVCGDGGHLMICGFNGKREACCPRVYHLECVHLDRVPPNGWICPSHICDECGRLGVKVECIECNDSWCADHIPSLIKRRVRRIWTVMAAKKRSENSAVVATDRFETGDSDSDSGSDSGSEHAEEHSDGHHDDEKQPGAHDTSMVDASNGDDTTDTEDDNAGLRRSRRTRRLSRGSATTSNTMATATTTTHALPASTTATKSSGRSVDAYMAPPPDIPVVLLVCAACEPHRRKRENQASAKWFKGRVTHV
jgi:CxxC motif-containing protein